VARFIGPALAGPVIAIWGVVPAIAANAVAYSFGAASILMLHIATADRRGHPAGASLSGEVADGLRYARRHAGLGPLLLYAAFAALLMRGVQEILPPFVERSFGRGADALAVLTASIGIGSLIAGLWVANRGRMEGSTRLAVWSGLAMAVATASFAATDNFAIGLFCGALIGAAGSIHGISVQTLLQSATDSEFRGRMLSLWGMITRACPALGALALGAAGEAFGLRIPTLVAVAVFLGVLAWGVARLGRMEQVLEATPAGRRSGKDDG